MKVAIFSTKTYDRLFFKQINKQHQHTITFFEARLTLATAPLANGFDVVCVFVNDQLGAPILQILAAGGVQLIALRCAGFNNVDLKVAEALNMTIVRVPAYSPYAVAEHTVGLILALNRKLHRAYNRVREGNFALEGLLGFDLNGKTVGLIGTGKIGQCTAKILLGFGCTVLAHDPYPNTECEALGIRYVPLDTILVESDIISLHCPLTHDTHYIIDEAAIQKMKPGVMLINTSRGPLVDTQVVILSLIHI